MRGADWGGPTAYTASGETQPIKVQQVSAVTPRRMIEPTKATLRAQRDALIAANARAQARIAELERGWLRRWWAGVRG